MPGQLGLEPTIGEYVAKLVEVFREVRRVLRPDATLWVNLGDSYANDGKWGDSTSGKRAQGLHGETEIGRGKRYTGMKRKDLIGIPWRVAFALQQDGWWLGLDIVCTSQTRCQNRLWIGLLERMNISSCWLAVVPRCSGRTVMAW